MSAQHPDSGTASELLVSGYCVHCRSRREMVGAIQVCTRRGDRDLKGHCAACGTPMYRLGGWDSVAAAAGRAVSAASRMSTTSATHFASAGRERA